MKKPNAYFAIVFLGVFSILFFQVSNGFIDVVSGNIISLFCVFDVDFSESHSVSYTELDTSVFESGSFISLPPYSYSALDFNPPQATHAVSE